MTHRMPAGAQIAFTKSWLERQGIEAQTIDVEAYIDPSLSYEENIKLFKRQFKLGGGRSRKRATRDLSAAECDVAIGNYQAGFNHEVTVDACACGHPDACVDLERAGRAAKKKAAAPKRKKVPYFTISKADRLIAENFTSRSDKQLHTDIIKLRDYIRYIELGDREVLMRGGYFKQVAHPDASGLSPANIFLHQNLKYTLERAYAEKDTRQPPRTPAAKPKRVECDWWKIPRDQWVDGHIKSPAMHWECVRLALAKGHKVPAKVLKDYPDLVKTQTPPAAAPDMASVPVRLGGGGIPPIPGMGAAAAPKPKRKTAAKPAAKPAKKAAAPKPKSKAKNGKTATGITLTAAQKKRLAAKGSITIKRDGKFVTVRG